MCGGRGVDSSGVVAGLGVDCIGVVGGAKDSFRGFLFNVLLMSGDSGSENRQHI